MSRDQRDAAKSANGSEGATPEAQISDESIRKIQTFLYELAGGTSNYRSLHSLTEQVEHQYHGRVLIELIQNAHDALLPVRNKASAERGRIEIIFKRDEGEHGTLYVANDGRPFSRSNFESLSQLGQSDKNPDESIGNKGIGFRSTLEIADSPEIYSRIRETSQTFDGFCFSFSPSIIERLTEPVRALSRPGEREVPLFGGIALVDWDERLIEKFRASVLSRGGSWLAQELQYLSPYLLPFPIRRSDASETVREFEGRGLATCLRFPLKSQDATDLVQNKMDGLDASTVLFLDKATSVVLDDGKTRRELSRRSRVRRIRQRLRSEVTITQGNRDVQRKYWMWSTSVKTADAPQVLQEAVRALPGKWPEIKQIAVSIAVSVSNEPERGNFSIVLPTLIGTGCATHISAAFFGDMSRTRIDFGNTYNRFLINTAAALAVDVVAHQLAGHGVDEARAIVDLLAPQGQQDVAAAVWRGAIEEAVKVAGFDIDDAPLFLADRGWTSLNTTYLIRPPRVPAVLTGQLLRTFATFDVFRTALDSRSGQLESLMTRYDEGVWPTAANLAETLEAIATHAGAYEPGFDWNGFWSDASELLGGDSSPLVGRKIVLGSDGELHASGSESAVFFMPRQGSGEDEELASETAVLEIPEGLQPYVAFLSEKIRVYDDATSRTQTPVRRFLGTKLVSRFRVEDIFNVVLIPRTPPLPVRLGGPEEERCRDILHWGLRLIANRAGREKGDGSMRLLRDIPVPCMGGWYPLRETTFGPGWTTLGGQVLTYLTGVGTPASETASSRLLLPPQDARWSGVNAPLDLLKAGGAFDGLRLLTIESDAWASRFEASSSAFVLPDICPPGVSQQVWNAYRLSPGTDRPKHQKRSTFKVGTLRAFAGMEAETVQNSVTRTALMEALLASVGRWEDGWDRLYVNKMEGSQDVVLLRSPLEHWLRSQPWVGVQDGTDHHWCTLSERWHVPKGVLAGRAWQFAHLKPLPATVAAQLDSDVTLAERLQRLGMPKFDPEVNSPSKSLLVALTEAAQRDDVPDPNVFLGQVRSAWHAFHPQAESTPLERILVRRNSRHLTAEKPSPENRLYLPDSRKSFVGALEQFDLPVIAIEPPDASRLAGWFQRSYGDTVQRTSELLVVPLVNDVQWDGVAEQRLRDSELAWTVPLSLTLTAFGGSQPQGASSKRFMEQLVKLREVKVCWVPQLQAALFRGDAKVQAPRTDAFWLAESGTLLVSETCRINPGLLAEALSLLLEREDLEVSLRLLLKECQGLDTDQDAISHALSQLKLSLPHYLEVLGHWRGDVGQVIRLVGPLLVILRPDASTALLDRDTDEAVTAFLDSLSDPRIEGEEIVAMARDSADITEFGMKAFRRFGDEVELDVWNAALELLGEATSTNREAASEFKSHLGAAIQPLRSLLAAIAARPGGPAAFSQMSSHLDDLRCPDGFDRRYWEVTFGHMASVVIADLTTWGASPGEIDALRGATSAEGLTERLREVGVNVALDPVQTARDNREKVGDAANRLQQVGLAWAMANEHQNPAEWESRAATYVAALSDVLEARAFTAAWSSTDVFALLKMLPRDPASATFWTTVAESSSFAELDEKLGLSASDLSESQRRLQALKEAARLRRRLVTVCGADFDGAEDNLSGLWAHIQRGIPEDALRSLAPFDVRKPSVLAHAKKQLKRAEKNGGAKQKGTPKYQSKAIEQLVGLAGEIHAFRMLQRVYGAAVISSASWMSSNSVHVFHDNKADDGFGCDFRFTQGAVTYHVEVKASDGDDESFTVGSSEIRLAMDLGRKTKRRRHEQFLILRVANALSSQPSFQLLPNPYDPRYQSQFAIEEAGARVRYSTKP